MRNRPDCVIGVDSSTTACKAIVWDRAGRVLGEGRAALDLLMPRPSWHEQQAEQWWTALAQALRQATASVAPQRLAALCIAAQRETFVAVEEQGQPLRNAIVWMDERARALTPLIAERYGAERFHQTTGKPLSANLSLPKLLWLAQNEPETIAHAYKVLDVHAFLVHRLTGLFRTSRGCADPMGLFNMQSDAWAGDVLRLAGLREDQMPDASAPGAVIGEVAPEAAALCGLPAGLPIVAGLREDQMPDASAPGAVIGEVTPEAAALCGLPAGLPIVAGLGDGQAAGLGASVAAPGLAYLNLGTAVVSGTITDTFVVDRAFRTMYGGAPGTYSLETVIIGGTYTVSWFVREFAAEMAAAGRPGSAEEALEAACRDLPPGASGLMLVPYWNSAMNPYWDASASGIVAGWRGIHGKAHLYRAILEGIAYEQRLHTSGVEAALGRSIDSYVAIGGGARSALWRQVIADVTGKTVLRSSTTEAAALGAGILAARGAGLFGDVAEASAAMAQRDPQRVEPDAANHATYSRLYDEVYRHLYPALQPYLQRLTELSEAST